MPSTAGGCACGIAVLAIVADVAHHRWALAVTYAARSEILLQPKPARVDCPASRRYRLGTARRDESSRRPRPGRVTETADEVASLATTGAAQSGSPTGRSGTAPRRGTSTNGDLDQHRRHSARALRARSDEGQDLRARRHHRRRHAGQRLHPAPPDDP